MNSEELAKMTGWELQIEITSAKTQSGHIPGACEYINNNEEEEH